MKRNEVYSFITKLSANVLLDNNLEPKDVAQAIKNTEKQNKKAIDTMTNGIYSNSGNPKIEAVVIIVMCCLGGFVLPFSLKLNLVISLSVMVVFEFILHKGFKLMMCEVSNRFQRDVKIENKVKLKYGDYRPVCVGYDQDGKIVVVDCSDKGAVEKFDSYGNFISDKEVLPNVVREYRIGRAKDLSSISKVVTSNLIVNYNEMGRASSDYNRSVNEEMADAKFKSTRSNVDDSNSF